MHYGIWMLPSQPSVGKESSTALSVHGVVLEIHITVIKVRRVGELQQVYSTGPVSYKDTEWQPGGLTAEKPGWYIKCFHTCGEGKPTQSICALISLHLTARIQACSHGAGLSAGKQTNPSLKRMISANWPVCCRPLCILQLPPLLPPDVRTTLLHCPQYTGHWSYWNSNESYHI